MLVYKIKTVPSKDTDLKSKKNYDLESITFSTQTFPSVLSMPNTAVITLSTFVTVISTTLIIPFTLEVPSSLSIDTQFFESTVTQCVYHSVSLATSALSSTPCDTSANIPLSVTKAYAYI
jgi:hypothetical protein